MTSAKIESKQRVETADRAGWIHFGAAVVFLLVAWIGWTTMKSALGYFVRKEPVPWPQGVTVDKKTFQNTSLAEKFGPYKLLEEREQKPDVLETLKIGTTIDSHRIKNRQSNWYLTRVYEDIRESENSPYRKWVLDIVFYTGGETTVPHVPDICILAGGAEDTGDVFIKMTCPGAPEPWDKEFEFKGLYYERPEYAGRYELVQYYLFSVNGEPEVSREKVRLALTGLTLRYIYYAKIQFFPQAPILNRQEANAKAKEFMESCLPAVLKELPSRADIDKLHRHKAAGNKKKSS